MDDSSSGSSCSDMEQCTSQSNSTQSLSVVPFPSEDRPDGEAVMPGEDLTSEGPSSLPPVQGACGTNDVKGPMGNGIQEKPEEPGEEDLGEPINGEECCVFDYSQMKWAEWEQDDEESVYNWEEETGCQSVLELVYLLKVIAVCLDKDEEDDDSLFSDPSLEEDVDNSMPPESPQEEEDVQLSSSVSSHVDQVSPEEHEACQDSPTCQPAENGDGKQSPEKPPELEEEEIVEMESQEPGTAKSSPGSSEQSEEGDLPSDKERTSCMNFRGLFHWLRKRVVCSLPGRKRRERSSKVPFCCH